MSIHVILGKPGSGKSLYATMRVIRELIETQRNVVTNLPLRPDALNEYIQKTYPQSNTRFVERVRVLTDEEMRTFWTIRGPGEDKGENGVAYFLDEAHIAFNARDWASIGRGALHYLSQHRKLGDIVWPITQSAGNLDKQFRSVSEDFTVLRNEYTAKFGPFRGRGRFVRKTYLTEPSTNGEPFETAQFTLDVKGVASCYDTAKGIGVHGNKADIGRRAKGIPIWTVVPLALLLGLSCVAIPWLLAKGTAKALTGGQQTVKGAANALAPNSGNSNTHVTGPAVGKAIDMGAPPPSAKPEPKDDTYLEGYTIVNKSLTVFLSDGRVLSSESKEILRLTDTYVALTDGKVYLARSRQEKRLLANMSAQTTTTRAQN